MEKMNGTTMDIIAENVEKLRGLFPEAFTEGKIDFDALQEVLGEYIDGREERYSFTWNGKSKARMLAQTPSTGTLRPCPEESVDWENTQNIFIEGDNLEVLKLLQKSYHKKVKMIYIDPPYNTGKDFVYKDNFKDNIKNYKEITGQIDGEGRNLSSNPETSGRYHTDWLNMIFPRLKLARNLLADDGALFISIDDSELENMKKLCDEIFGEENFINIVSVKLKNVAGASGGGEDKRLKKNIEYVLVYSKNYNLILPFQGVYTVTPIEKVVTQYREEGKSWKYTSILINPGKKEFIGSTVDGDGNEIKIYKRTNPVIKSINQIIKEENISEKEAYNKYSSSLFEAKDAQSSIRTRIIDAKKMFNIKEDIVSIEYIPRTGKNKGRIYEQFYKGDKCRLFAWLKDISTEINGTLYKKDLQGTYWDLVSETNNLTKEGGIAFQNGKKPIKLISRMIEMMNSKDMIVLDFFAGSSTTAHAVIKLNEIDNGNRKFVMVQLPEPIELNTPENKKYIKYLNEEEITPIVTEVSKERIRRAGKMIKSGHHNYEGDLGFKVFKLDSTNIKPWDMDFSFDEKDLINQIDNIKSERTEEDILFEILIKYGLDLNLPIMEHTIASKKVFDIGMGALIICLSDSITLDVVKGIAKLKDELNPEIMRVVLKDSGFKDDVVKTNAVQILKQAGIKDVRSL